MKNNIDIDQETQMNIKVLKDIRDDVATSPAVRIQAIQTMQKTFDSLGVVSEVALTEDDIMKKIRGSKK